MNLFIIILSLILFHENYIYGLDTEGLNGIDVLATLKAKVPNYDLHDFVKSDQDYKELTGDLNTYCSTSDTSKSYSLICNMIAYELTKACEISPGSRPSKAMYKVETTPTDICAKKNIQLTNEWIWNKITNNGEKKIGVNADQLCTKVTSDTKTLRLARFFYKIAPLVRKYDLSKQSKG